MSETKALKEKRILTQSEKRFEETLQKKHNAIQQKSGTKKLDKVPQRIGRAIEKSPSIQQQYTIEVSVDEVTGLATEVTWERDEKKRELKENNLGVYFLRTNMNIKD